MTRFGRVLRALRQWRRVTQEALAESANVDATYISHLERGVKQNPSAEVVRALGMVLGLQGTTRYLFEKEAAVAKALLDGTTDDEFLDLLIGLSLAYEESDQQTKQQLVTELTQLMAHRQQEADTVSTDNGAAGSERPPTGVGPPAAT
ncbi:MAG: hypothetical protein CL878_08445 [Dehalococcoidia bacterium]|nr:hypothetical protein [Dehalococcoidia bacterium]